MNTAPNEGDDASLVALALQGRQQAFTALMRRHKDKTYRFIRAYVGDAEEAYDLLQETFVAAWSALSGFDTGRPFTTWLKRIALNKCRDWTRRRKVRRFFFGAAKLETSPDIADPTPSPDTHLENALERLELAIADLPPSLKEPLLLTAIEGLSHQEAAGLLGLSVKAVETRVYRAKLALARTALEE